MKNQYQMFGDVVCIWLLGPGLNVHMAKISACDFDKVNSIPSEWKPIIAANNRVYVQANYKRKRLPIHRLIMDAPTGMVVDHIDGDPLNNCRENLRVVTQQENGHNRQGPNRNNTSGHRGIHWNKSQQRWVARCTVNHKHHHIGQFKELDDAVAAYEKWMAENVPTSQEALRRRSG